MVTFLGLLYLIVAGHLVNAAINYIRDRAVVSAILNSALAAVSFTIGFFLSPLELAVMVCLLTLIGLIASAFFLLR